MSVAEPSPGCIGRDSNLLPFLMGDKIPNGASVVYFLAAPGRIKVGVTKKLDQRFNDLNSSNAGQLTLIGWLYGDARVERAIQRALNGFRIRGEWFEDCADVRSTIAAAQSGNLPSDLPFELPIKVKAPTKARPPVNQHVAWASEALRKIAGSVPLGEKNYATVGRVADRLGFSYWRTFDLWYRKAHRLETKERDRINAILGSPADD